MAGTRTPRRSKLNASPVPVYLREHSCRLVFTKPGAPRDHRFHVLVIDDQHRGRFPKLRAYANGIIGIGDESFALLNVVIGVLVGSEIWPPPGPG